MLKIINSFSHLAASILLIGFSQFSQANILDGDCSVQLQCPDNSIISCEGSNYSCSTGANYVSCNGQTTHCNDCVAPPVMDIVELIPAYYPPQHPYGRYELSPGTAGPNYFWSVNYGEIMSGSPGDQVVIKSSSVGWFTITVTATSTVPGCDKTTIFSENFYVEENPF
ncbi:hypothetical protein [Microbulbifer discodermiae]|uniref:hypothetical protein n=1 Tax=Microbulbifer sp. 2201CG32-9 TaxID=3232309 RepID=UPI00345BBCC9